MWDPEQYERFKAERTQPFYDLLALVAREPGLRVLDLGCGTGELTAVLHQRLAAAITEGIDSSSSMLERTEEHRHEGLSFRQADIESFVLERPVDLLFSNAALQWVDEHQKLFERLLTWVKPGGQFAVQMPANHDHPSHTIAAQLATEAPFRKALAGFTRQSPVLAAEQYARLFEAQGCERWSVRYKTYTHELEDRDGVVQWVRGTLLTAYQQRLDPELFERFVDEYRQRIAATYPDDRPFIYPFKRILLWARLERGR